VTGVVAAVGTVTNYSLVKERPPRQQRATIDAGAMTLIYNHWGRCAFDAPGAHRRRPNPARPANNHDYFSGFVILRVSRTSRLKRRKRFTAICLSVGVGNLAHDTCTHACWAVRGSRGECVATKVHDGEERSAQT